jgi:glycosyltransferase involved in cell wall biosynthesis
MTKKTISIALCTYNGERFLKDQLDSYCRQTRLPDELIVCDDGSEDGTVQLIQEFAKNSPFPVRLYRNEKNLGFARNFQQALSLCRGAIIALSDQDDIWIDDRLARFEQIFLSDFTIGYAFCDAAIVDENLQDLGYTFWDVYKAFEKKPIKFNALEFTNILLSKRSSIAGCLIVMQSDIAKLTMPLPDLWHHDDWIPFAGSLLKSVMMIPETLIKYRLHSTQSAGIPIKRTSRKRYLHLAKKWQIAQARIIEDDVYLHCRINIVARIGAKIKHLKARGQMPKNLLKRLLAVIREIKSFRYFNYSSGLKSAAKDLFYLD